MLDPASTLKSPKKPTPRRGSSPDNNLPGDPVTRWALAVGAGDIVAGPHVRASCARHLRDLVDAGERGLIWDQDQVKRVLDFFPGVLCLAGGQFEGNPFRLHPSQQFVIGSLFGWKRRDGRRRFRRAYIEQGKGNGKSPLAAGIGMYCLVADGEQRAEVYAAASIKSQAMVLFRDAVAMWQQSGALGARLTPSGGNPIWNLADLKSGSFFRPISSEEDHSGPRPSCALCDEIHEHRNGHMIEMLERGFKFRRQQPIGPYIADFVCFEAGLVIELDGDQHGSDDSVAYDERRTLFLQKVGFDVIRFPNREVNNSLDNVLDAIAHHLKI